jgi:hypothetical protein
MLGTWHLNTGAAHGALLTIDDGDKRALVRALAAVFGPKPLAYCVMSTHVHAVAEAADETVARALFNEALRLYARVFNARHGFEGRLRGQVTAVQAPSPQGLAKQIRYAHDNPVKVNDDYREVDDPVSWPWSSAPAFAGLSRAPYANVARARELMGESSSRAVSGWVPRLVDLEPSRVPAISIERILAATALVYGLTMREVSAKSRDARVLAAKQAFVALGRLEGWRDPKLGLVLGKSRSRLSQIGSAGADLEAVRMARTYCRSPELHPHPPKNKLVSLEPMSLDQASLDKMLS